MSRRSTPARDVAAKEWWERRRVPYNFAVIMSIFLGYLAYAVVVSHFADVIGRPIVNGAGKVVGTTSS